MSSKTKLLGVLGWALLSATGQAAAAAPESVSVRALPPIPYPIRLAGLSFAQTAKFISIRFNFTDDPHVYFNGPGNILSEVKLTRELKNFTIQTTGKGAELSIQVLPWSQPYPAALIFPLNSRWALGETGLRDDDVKHAGNGKEYDSSGSMVFTYDKANHTVTWTDGTNTGTCTMDSATGKCPGIYVIIKLANSGDTAELFDPQGLIKNI